MDILRFDLPYPPSINHYYIHSNAGVCLGAKGRQYRRDVSLLLHRHRDACGGIARLSLTINIFTPDKRKRDLDNTCKATLDALQYARVFEDDSQIDMLTVIRRGVVKDGYLSIWITECSSSE